MFAPTPDSQFARDVRAGLTMPEQKTLPCSYLFDDLGRTLHQAITLLPEYGLARAETRLNQERAADLLANLPAPLTVAGLGGRSLTATAAILGALGQRERAVYYPVDPSAAALAECARELGPLAEIRPLELPLLEGLQHVAQRRPPAGSLLVLFPGGAIGNLEPDAALEFAISVRELLSPGDVLLLGTDLVKPTAQLLDAYDDPTGVTAAFNLNLLGRINRELDGDFDLRRFAHVIRYHEEAQRVEMHLRSRVYQIVSIRKADLIVDFAAGETICTEVSHKFYPEQVETMAKEAGFRLECQWVDTAWGFAENLLVCP